MKSVKEYAKMKGVTHQSVYKMIGTHKNELEPYIVHQGRTRYLTDEAIAILERYRDANPVIVNQTNDKERIEELETTIKQMLVRENELQREVAEANKELRRDAELRAEQAKLIATAEASKLLLEEKTNRLKETEDKLHFESQRADRAEEALEAERNKTFFQRLFKK